MRCTKAIVYKDFIRHNIRQIKSTLNCKTKLCCAVKADGYGCGSLTTAKIAQEEGCEYLAIATIDEGIELRNNNISAKLLLLSLCTPDELEYLCKYNITPTLYDSQLVKDFDKVCEKNSTTQDVFLAVDTGMGRIGCYAEEAPSMAKFICQECKNLNLAGVITHFAVSDSISDANIKYTKEQAKRFESAIDGIKALGIDPGIRTCASSAAAMAFPELQMDMVRPGIIIYGYYPDQITKQYLAERNIEIDLKPVMQFESQVVSIKHFKKGMSISYGRTWVCPEDTDIAIIPAGYADGLLRRNSPGMEVTINGKPYPIRGRICMDQCMVDIGQNNKDVKRWDKVIFFGPKEKGALKDANDVANETGTISYEVMTSLSKRVVRHIV